MLIFICDDNIDQCGIYHNKLNDVAKENNVQVEIKTYTSGKHLLFEIDDYHLAVDAVYLDINMPEMNGIEVANELRDRGFLGEIIFLTVSKQHFIPAFDVGAFNYIVKEETSPERFEKIFLRVVKSVRKKQEEYILLVGGGTYKNILVDSIYYFEIVKRIVTVYYEGGSFEFFQSINKLENQLYDRGFIRVHRGYLVKQSYIESISSKEITLRNDTKIPIGRTYYQNLKEAISI